MRVAVVRPSVGVAVPWRALVPGVVVLALAAGFVAGRAPVEDAELARLLRMMAVLKLAFVAAGAAFVWWRLGHAVRFATATGYLGALAAAAIGPGFIWGMAHVVLGAALLHGGLGAIGLIGWRDAGLRTALAALSSRGYRRPRHGRPGS